MKKDNKFHNWTTRNHFFENYTPSDIADKFHQLGWNVDENRIVHVKRAQVVLVAGDALGNPTKPHVYLIRSHKLTPKLTDGPFPNTLGWVHIQEESPLGSVITDFDLLCNQHTVEFNNYMVQFLKQESGLSWIEYDEYTFI